MFWSGLYPSQKHLAWLLCSGMIHDCLAAAIGTFHMHSADPVELRPSQFSLWAESKGVFNRHTTKPSVLHFLKLN